MTNKVVILDGAMGTMLQKSGMKVGQIPELLNIENTQMIIDIHKKYIEAGAEIIYVNTFGANGRKLKDGNLTEVVRAALKNGREAAKGTDVKVALDLGPLGEMLEPMGTLKFEEAYEMFKEIILAGKDLADLVVIETMTDLYEVRAAVLAARENSDLPIFVTMSFEEDGRTFAGVSVETYVNSIGGLGVSAIGMNCSLGPVEMYDMAKRLCEITDVDIIIKPNAGLPKMDGSYDLSVENYVDAMEKIYNLGVKYLGGCCGTNEEYIKALSERLKGKEVIERAVNPIHGPSSSTKFISNDRFMVVGERLNPTGKKRFQQALVDEEMSYFISQAIEQVDAGAKVLDLNVGYPGINEAAMQIKIIKAIQSVLDTPIQIDSTKAEALEAGLRIYNGKAIVNSVNGEREKLEEILPLVKKYNAQVIGLALDEDGIPETAEGRFNVAKKIVEAADSYGIPREDVYIDCLALTVSSQPEGAMETLKAITMIKEQLGVKTALGVSNISFGLPNRELINQSFLTMAMYAGLDLAIINPNSSSMMDAIYGYRLLNNEDIGASEYIGRYANTEKKTEVKASEYDIMTAISKGLDLEVRDKVKALLETMTELEVVDNELIPALDKVGDDYEKGTIFLPQLIKSANAAQAGFEVIKNKIINSGKQSISKGDIVVATVKGDIHDIGKNIAKVILENYGYNVIDLGKDVSIEEVVRVAKEKNIYLVGLSALMTTTLDNMKETIVQLRAELPDVKIMVGGAVLTEEYSKVIDADYYLKDAKVNIEVARKIFGGEID